MCRTARGAATLDSGYIKRHQVAAASVILITETSVYLLHTVHIFGVVFHFVEVADIHLQIFFHHIVWCIGTVLPVGHHLIGFQERRRPVGESEYTIGGIGNRAVVVQIDIINIPLVGITAP